MPGVGIQCVSIQLIHLMNMTIFISHSQGTVATCLRYDEIFNHYSITNLMLSSKVAEY